jgi:hypothetical protein
MAAWSRKEGIDELQSGLAGSFRFQTIDFLPSETEHRKKKIATALRADRQKKQKVKG